MSATTVTCLTPAGSGAIATVAVSGPDGWAIVRRLFRPATGKPLPDQPAAGSTWFGRLGEGAGDEVIVAITPHPALPPKRGEGEEGTASIPSPQSGEEPCIPSPRFGGRAGWGVEIHCHGGRQVVRWLIDQFCHEGCVEVPPSSSDEDPWALLQHAKTLRTAAILLDQANGAFARAVESIRQSLEVSNIAEGESGLRELARFAPVGKHLIEPWRVAITGAPNAGKSSLLNALAGFQRSIVAPVPGTTRDVVTATLAFDGWPVELSDTAGLREPGDELEAEGVGRAREQIAAADLCLWVIDVTGLPPTSVEQFAGETGIDARRVLPVLNKTDQPPAWDLAGVRGGVCVSAVTGEGLDGLIRRMAEMLVPEPPAPGAAVPYSAESIEMVEEVLRLLADGRREDALNGLSSVAGHPS